MLTAEALRAQRKQVLLCWGGAQQIKNSRSLGISGIGIYLRDVWL